MLGASEPGIVQEWGAHNVLTKYERTGTSVMRCQPARRARAWRLPARRDERATHSVPAGLGPKTSRYSSSTLSGAPVLRAPSGARHLAHRAVRPIAAHATRPGAALPCSPVPTLAITRLASTPRSPPCCAAAAALLFVLVVTVQSTCPASQARAEHAASPGCIPGQSSSLRQRARAPGQAALRAPGLSRASARHQAHVLADASADVVPRMH